MSNNIPVVLCFSGHDPSGGAGIQADIETLVSHSCHCATVITVLTAQDSSNVKQLHPQNPVDIILQAQTLLADMTITVIKIGLIGSVAVAKAIVEILALCPQTPVIFDPVLIAGGGKCLHDPELLQLICSQILAKTTVLTPNINEARLLTGLQTVNECGLKLLELGCENVLITGADTMEDSQLVKNNFFSQQQQETFAWERLPHSYHGSGCTLASSIAGLIAHGLDTFAAVGEAQEYTWNSLQAAYKVGQGQHNPQRLFWKTST